MITFNPEMENSESAQEEYVITPYGYGKIIASTDCKVTVELSWGGRSYLDPSSIAASISFTVKSFSNDKKELNFSWPVKQHFKDLYSELSQLLALPPHIYIVLVYPMGSLKKVQPSDSPFSLKLKPGAKLLALSHIKRHKFTWNDKKKGENITLSNNKLTIQKTSDASFESVLGNLCLDKGSFYWEIKIDCFIGEGDFFIGVALDSLPLNERPSDTGKFWGILSSGAVKVAPGRDFEEYGDTIQTGDVIGVSLEYSDQTGRLAFSKNGNDFGVAFEEVAINVYPVVCLLYTNAQATLGFK